MYSGNHVVGGKVIDMSGDGRANDADWVVRDEVVTEQILFERASGAVG